MTALTRPLFSLSFKRAAARRGAISGRLLAGFLTLVAMRLCAQQEPMLSQYALNALALNPAVAGNKEVVSLQAAYRRQWIGLEGAPSSAWLNAHTPLADDRIGVGLSLAMDRVGPTGMFHLGTSYAYRIRLNDRARLAGGLQVSLDNWYGRWSSLPLQQLGDGVFAEDLNRWLVNFGAGFLFQHERYFVGVSCPNLAEPLYRTDELAGLNMPARQYRHLYLSGGLALPIQGEDLALRPTLMLRRAGVLSRDKASGQTTASPLGAELGCVVIFARMLQIGAAYRGGVWGAGRGVQSNALGFHAALFLRNGMRIGMAYDLQLNRLRSVAGGSPEVSLGYDFDTVVRRVASPRYF